MGSRVRTAFNRVRTHAARTLPWLRGARLVFCRDADRKHREKWRWFMHSNHYPMAVCVARAAETELTDLELFGMLPHEFGHIVGENLGFPEHKKTTNAKGTPFKVQAEADWIAIRLLGFPIKYNDRTLQELRVGR